MADIQELAKARLPWRFGFSHPLGNLGETFHFLRSDLAQCDPMGDARRQKHYDDCVANLLRFVQLSKQPLGSYYVGFQILQTVVEDMHLCLPEDMLPSRWNTIQKRFEQYSDKEKEKARIKSWDAYKLCLKAFDEETTEPPKLISNEVRYAMRDLSRFFAEPLEVDVSRSETIYRRNCWLSFMLIAPIATVALIDLFSSAMRVVDGKIGAGNRG